MYGLGGQGGHGGQDKNKRKKNDILIFDTFYASLIFYCIENKNLSHNFSQLYEIELPNLVF